MTVERGVVQRGIDVARNIPGKIALVGVFAASSLVACSAGGETVSSTSPETCFSQPSPSRDQAGNVRIYGGNPYAQNNDLTREWIRINTEARILPENAQLVVGWQNPNAASWEYSQPLSREKGSNTIVSIGTGAVAYATAYEGSIGSDFCDPSSGIRPVSTYTEPGALGNVRQPTSVKPDWPRKKHNNYN